MTWFKVDDKLHDHRKARKAGKAAMGVWVMAGSWAMDNEMDGFIPDDVLLRWGNRTDAGRLVAAGLWFVDEWNGERGWRFHDWSMFQPSAAVTAAKRAKEHEGAVLGNHKRWHVKRKISDPDCEYCYRGPDGEPDRGPDDLPESGGESGANRPVPVPVPEVTPNGVTRPGSHLAVAAEPPRPDVARLCDHLADRIETNGSKRPDANKGWTDAARLMLDRDGRLEDEVHRAIDWCQDDAFWRGNILSMPKLREKYDQLRLQASRTSAPRGQQATDDLFAAAAQRAAERDGTTR